MPKDATDNSITKLSNDDFNLIFFGATDLKANDMHAYPTEKKPANHTLLDCSVPVAFALR